jgi:hypothetical protein
MGRGETGKRNALALLAYRRLSRSLNFLGFPQVFGNLKLHVTGRSTLNSKNVAILEQAACAYCRD